LYCRRFEPEIRSTRKGRSDVGSLPFSSFGFIRSFPRYDHLRIMNKGERMSFKRLIEAAVLPVAVGAFAIFFVLERRRPLRRRREGDAPHIVRNLAAGGMAAAALQLCEQPVTSFLTREVEARRLGLLQYLPMPRLLKTIVGIALMDYTLYVWHYLMHKVPFLWRLHVPHHIDIDLDTTTALRFHFTELAISVGWRAVQILALGIDRSMLAAWQIFLLPSIFFHHSNIELSPGAERRVNLLVVTPRMHGIHHSNIPEETDSNWSSGLTIWDKLHGTYRDDVWQDAIVIGVPAFPAPVSVAKYAAMPFVEQQPTWQLPADED
jgi:sterol desaturase/sphingolipid hydroxylase (fatty acid hydroxylase superfamily)